MGAWSWREGATGKGVKLREQAGHWEWRVLGGEGTGSCGCRVGGAAPREGHAMSLRAA